MTVVDTAPAIQQSPWHGAMWLNCPEHVREAGGSLVVRAAEGSDFWRGPAPDSACDSGHALLRPFSPGECAEVSFRLDFTHRLDQAGLLVRTGPACWIKAGVEICEGVAHVGAVVTNGVSDWSMSPVPSWRASIVTVRASWTAEGVLIRARSSQSGWRTVRLAPWAGSCSWAGPFCASPDRGDLEVTFTSWRTDVAAHEPALRRVR
jgi:hypothetical protein